MNFLKMLIVLCALAIGCSSQDDYQKAFSDETALNGNTRNYNASVDLTLRTVKQVLVKKGFTIDQADISNGVIKAERNMQDSSEKEVSYNITASADVSESPTDQTSVLTFAASQQTVLHRKEYTWWHLLWVLPLFPIGTEYQTVVTNEGNVTDNTFYSDFFAEVEKSLNLHRKIM